MANFINPQSECKLLNVSIQNDYKNQYTFSSIQEQTNFFLSKATSKNFTKLTFIRDGEIAVQGQIYSLYNSNYLMFKNTGFKDKWFYAFITEIEYSNENCSIIHYELDVFQSWYFEINYLTSFIVRQHVTDDTIGANTIDEGLGYGDYIFHENTNHLLVSLNNYIYVMCVTQGIPNDDSDHFILGEIYDNIYSGLKYLASSHADLISDALIKYQEHGKSEAVQYIKCIPHACMPDFEDVSEQAGQPIIVPSSSQGMKGYANYDFTQNSIDGYIPKNNKLFCSPYNEIELTDNNGHTAEFKPELFNTFGHCQFCILSNMSGNVTVSCFPTNYGKLSTNIESNNFSSDLGIEISDFPQCAWTSDFYKNWLAQNQVSNNISLGFGVENGLLQAGIGAANLGIGIATANPVAGVIGASALASGISQSASSIANYYGNIHKAQVTPPQAKSHTNNMNALSAHNLVGFYVNHKTIKGEIARVIDNYFTMFGYKVNKLEVPNLRSRTNWNYIETKNINITGNIPNDHLNKIKNMFDNGVTLWHNDNVGNYNRENAIR